nr:DUF2786 domain-containing protein [Acidimicrobiia bacterium]
LLAKAESTTFAEEADALTAKAQQLMARHRIDRAALETEGRRSTDRPVGRRIWLDDPYADAKAHLLAQVAKANRCRSVSITDVGCCHVIGFASDLAVVELLHTSLLVQATAAMAAAGSRTDGQGRSRTRSFRSSFLYAFAMRIGERLREAVADAEAEGVAEHGAGVLPVLARRDEEVDEVVAESFPDLVRRRAPRLTAEGWAAGRAAADMADLSVGRPVERAG